MKAEDHVQWSPNWLLSGGKLTYSVQAPLLEDQISSIVHTMIYPLEMFGQPELVDLRGRGSNQELLAGPAISPNSYELLRIDGSFIPTEEAEVSEDFSVRVQSSFKEFSSGSHIKHSVECFCQDQKLQLVPINLLGFVMPIKISFFRLGFAFYSPTRAGLFGVSPEVLEELIIDCNEDEFRLELHSRALSKKHELPKMQGEFFNWLQLALSGLFNIDLESRLSSY